LPGLVNHVAALHGTALSQWFEQRKLIIIQLGKGNTFGVSIKLLVVLSLVSHREILRATQHNPNLSRTCCREDSVRQQKTTNNSRLKNYSSCPFSGTH